MRLRSGTREPDFTDRRAQRDHRPIWTSREGRLGPALCAPWVGHAGEPRKIHADQPPFCWHRRSGVQSTTRSPEDATSSRNRPRSCWVTGPISPVPIVRPSTVLTHAISPIVPVVKHSSAA